MKDIFIWAENIRMSSAFIITIKFDILLKVRKITRVWKKENFIVYRGHDGLHKNS